MKKWYISVGAILAACFAAAIVLLLLYANRNPNVGVALADQEDGSGLLACLEETGLQVHSGSVNALPDDCAVYVIEAENLTLTGPILQAAGDTPVIFLNRQPEEADACYIGGNGQQAGRAQGEMLLMQDNRGDWNDDGVVTCLVLGAAYMQPDMQQWMIGVSEVLAEEALDMEFIGYYGAAFSRENAKEICLQALSEYGKDLETVLVCYDAATLGALDAVQESGRSVGRNLTLMGAGHSSDVAAMVAEGKLNGYALLDEEAFCQAVLAAVEACRVGKTPEGLVLEYSQVLPE